MTHWRVSFSLMMWLVIVTVRVTVTVQLVQAQVMVVRAQRLLRPHCSEREV